MGYTPKSEVERFTIFATKDITVPKNIYMKITEFNWIIIEFNTTIIASLLFASKMSHKIEIAFSWLSGSQKYLTEQLQNATENCSN